MQRIRQNRVIFIDVFETLISGECLVDQRIPDILRRLRQMKFAIIVWSDNPDQDYVESLLRRNGLIELIDMLVKKPDIVVDDKRMDMYSTVVNCNPRQDGWSKLLKFLDDSACILT